MQKGMYRIWQIFDPFRALIGLAAALTFLALLIHMLLLSTPRFNWIEGGGSGAKAAVSQVAPAAPGPTQ
jgi:light-harvesting complex 1 alpha chain